MKYINNNKGMALVTILFLIVIFSIVGTLILNFTVSNAKQTHSIEEDMQAVDAAEMGIVRYRNELMTKLNNELRVGIESAISAIDIKNQQIAKSNAKLLNGQKPLPYIEVNEAAVIEQMTYDGFFNTINRFKIGYNPQEQFLVFPNSIDVFKIEEYALDLTAPNFPLTLQFSVKSTGISGDDHNEIFADFSFDLAKIISVYVNPGEITAAEDNKLEKPAPPTLWTEDAVELPISSKNCQYTNRLEDQCKYTNNLYINDHILNVGSEIKGNMIVQKNDLDFKDSNLHVDGNVLTGSIRDVKNSNLQANGNITFGNMNGNAMIDNVLLKASDIINIGNIGGNGISNSMLHAGEQVNIGEINNGGITGSQISSMKEINFKNVNKGITNSTIYANDNINFAGHMNDGGIIKSTIVTNNILKFGIMNKGIADSYIYAKNNLNFDTFNGSAHIENSVIHTDDILNFKDFNGNITGNSVIYGKDRINLNMNLSPWDFKGSIAETSFVCSGGSIAKGIKDKATNGNVIENVSFEECLKLAGKGTEKESIINESKLNDFSVELQKAIDEADYKYQ